MCSSDLDVVEVRAVPRRASDLIKRRVDEPDGSALQLIGERHDRGPLRRPGAGTANDVDAGLSRNRGPNHQDAAVDGRVVGDIRDRSRRQPQAALVGGHAEQLAGCAARRHTEDGLVPDLLAAVASGVARGPGEGATRERGTRATLSDRKSTRLNSSH